MKQIKTKHLFFITTTMWLIISMILLPSIAVEYTAIQLTDNDIRDNFGGASNGYITWFAGEGTEREIFLYEASSDEIIQITNNNYEDSAPKVHEGLVTWIGRPHDGEDFEVFLYNHKTGITTRITDNNLNELQPQVHDGLVTWYTAYHPSVGPGEIYLYDSTTGTTTQITSNSYSDYEPKVNNGLVTWWGYSNGGSSSEIFIYDSSSGIKTQITNNIYPDDAPQIHEGLVAWRSFVDGIVKLFIYDSANGLTTYVDDLIYSYPFILHDGNIAYQTQENQDFEIFLYNYFDGTKTQITFNDYDDRVGDLHNGNVVWTVNNNLYLYEYASGRTDFITGGATSPMITSGFITWMGSGGTAGPDYEIFIAGLFSESTIDFDPNTLNLDSKGKWVTVYIELPDDFSLTAADIDVSTVLFNGLIPADTSFFTVGDYDADGIVDLMIKFDRGAVQTILNPADSVEITISGNFFDGSQFEGMDIIRVI